MTNLATTKILKTLKMSERFTDALSVVGAFNICLWNCMKWIRSKTGFYSHHIQLEHFYSYSMSLFSRLFHSTPIRLFVLSNLEYCDKAYAIWLFVYSVFFRSWIENKVEGRQPNYLSTQREGLILCIFDKATTIGKTVAVFQSHFIGSAQISNNANNNTLVTNWTERILNIFSICWWNNLRCKFLFVSSRNDDFDETELCAKGTWRNSKFNGKWSNFGSSECICFFIYCLLLSHI